MNQTLSIVIPTYNRRPLLERLLDTLEGAWWLGSRFEVIVAVDGSSDGTAEMLETKRPSFSMHTVNGPQRGAGAARNAALRAATGEIVLFLDDDVVPVAGLIERHLAVHSAATCAAVIGPMVAPPRSALPSWLRWEAWTLQKQYDAMLAGAWAPTPRQFYTANASVRRSLLESAGGFDESYRRAEDVELARRLEDRGASFYFLPEAAVLHEPHRSFEAWQRVPYDYGQADVRMAREKQRSTLADAYREWNTRHPLNRLPPALCVGHERRSQLTLSLFARAIRLAEAIRAPERVQLALCSALYNVRYWQGVADATGLRSRVWRDRADSVTVGAARPEAIAA